MNTKNSPFALRDLLGTDMMNMSGVGGIIANSDNALFFLKKKKSIKSMSFKRKLYCDCTPHVTFIFYYTPVTLG